MFNTVVNKIKSNKQNVDIKLVTMRGTIAPIDPDEAASILHIDEMAAEDARTGIPLATASFPSRTEAHIQNFVSQRVDEYIEWGNARLKFCDDTLHDNEVENKIVLQLKNAVKKFEEQDLKAWTADYSADLNDMRKKAEEAVEDLDKFRKDNDLREIPYRRTATQKMFDYVLLLVLLFVETICNYSLFGQGLEGGKSAGICVAVLCAGINLAASWYFFAQKLEGLRIRCKTVSEPFKVGLLVTLLWFIVEISFGFGVAHFREALGLLVERGSLEVPLEEAAKLAAGNYFEPLSDILSWGLCLMTIGFGTLAYIDGTKQSEPFPHYEYKFDQTEDLKDDFKELLEEALGKLNDLKNATVEEIRSAIAKIETNLAAFSNAVADKETSETQFNNAISTSRTAYKALIKRYQETNIRKRSLELRKEIPEYFSTPINIEDEEIWKRTMPRFNISEDRNRLAEQTELKRTVQQELEQLITSVQEASADAIKHYQLKQMSSESGERA